MDWNWFFTAVAQCSAAIVGFIGGFVITKILNSENEYNHLKVVMHDLKNKIDNQKRCISIRSFDWYNTKMRELVKYTVDYEEIVLKGKGDVDYSCINDFNYSPYDDINEIKEEICEDWNTFKGQRFQNTSIASILPTSPKELYDKLEEERELIDREYVNTRALNDEIEKNISIISSFTNSSGSYKFIILVLIILFYIGVIYPLSFTPIVGNVQLCQLKEIPIVFIHGLFSIKGFILFVISIVFTLLLVYFLIKSTKMKISSDELSYLNQHTEVESFSKYFKNILGFDIE